MKFGKDVLEAAMPIDRMGVASTQLTHPLPQTGGNPSRHMPLSCSIKHRHRAHLAFVLEGDEAFRS